MSFMQRESVLGTNFLKEAPGSLITNSRIPRNFSIALYDGYSSSIQGDPLG